MPNATIYIRKEDWKTWQEIQDKPTFLHNCLNMADAYKSMTPTERKQAKKAILVAKETVTQPSAYERDLGFCSHMAVKGFCKKGCK